MKSGIFLSLFFTLLFTSPVNAETYMTQKEFLAQAFDTSSNLSASTSFISNTKPQKKTLWLNKNLQQKMKNILGHPYPKLRLGYWKSQDKSVWFLDEIGKEKPISFAISIIQDKIHSIRVLAFRESRGYEIRSQAFGEQFLQAQLSESNRLNQNIDGITGATMSVNAMKKVARIALMLAEHIKAEAH